MCLLPPANEVCEGYVFTGVCLSTGACMSHDQLVLRGVCVVFSGVWVVFLGGVHGFFWAACMVFFGGVHGFFWGCACFLGACGHVWFFRRGCMVFFSGGHAWFFSWGVWFFGREHAWFFGGRVRGFFGFRAGGQYASYWNAFLFEYIYICI